MHRSLLVCLVLLAALMLAAAPARGEIVTRTVEYTHDGVRLVGYLAYDDAVEGKRPGVLVVHEWWGLNDYVKRRTRELAEAGYVAFAADIFGDGKAVTTPAEAQQLAGPFYAGDPSLLRDRAGAALDVLRRQEHTDPERLAAVGYCFGGTAVLELARSGADIDLAVCFHGGLDTRAPAEQGAIKARILVLNGAADPMIPYEQRQAFMKEMHDAGADWTLVEYGGAMHAFTNPDADKAGLPGVAYNRKADERSRAEMLRALEETFGG